MLRTCGTLGLMLPLSLILWAVWLAGGVLTVGLSVRTRPAALRCLWWALVAIFLPVDLWSWSHG